jgi:uncharacterized lipoprotein
MTTHRYQPHPDAAARSIDGHVFIITPDSRQHELSGEVEWLVWELCDSAPRTEAELLEAILQRFDVDQETAQKDLGSFLTHLVRSGVFARFLE